MDLLEKLKNNKGTISSKLGKELAQEALAGNESLLEDALELCCYDLSNKKAKGIRAGAAKIIEIIAEKRPQWVAPHLVKIRPALDVEEPQTRWMIIRTFGFCAALNPREAARVMGYAREYIQQKQGVCLSGSAELYLGEVGALDPHLAEKALDILLEAAEDPLPNERDWILEGLISLSGQLNASQAKLAMEIPNEMQGIGKKATLKRMDTLRNKLQSRLEEEK